MKHKKIALLSLPIIALLTGCGGGGGGGGGSISSLSNGDYRNTISGDYETEYNYQTMLSEVNPLSLNDYGYDGTGVKVAVVDTGIDVDHPEFDGKTISGYDFINDSASSGFDSDSDGHGTHVASIIAGERDGTGMRGVAYDSTLYSYKKIGSGIDDTEMASLFNRHVTDNINVSNNSWLVYSGDSEVKVTGVTTAYMQTNYSAMFTAIKAAQANGTLFIWANGNDGYFEASLMGGLPYHDSDIADEWLTVVSVDSNLTETNYTNRCGTEAKDWCVTAPGGGDSQSTDGIRAADANSSGYTRLSGTSMAAPHVSGIAAALMEKFPNLTPAQIATRIKNTASLVGLTGSGGETTSNSSTSTMNAIFGHGLVNAQAASASIGSLNYIDNGGLSSGVEYEKNKISLPSGLSSSVVSQLMNDDFVVFDSFDGANFNVKGSDIFQTGSIPQSFGYKQISHDDDYSKNTLFKNSDYLFNPLTLTSSDNENLLTNNLFWKEKSNLIDTIPFNSSSNIKQISLANHYDGFMLAPFLRTSIDSSIEQAGLMYASEINNDSSYSLGFVTGNQLLDLGHINNNLNKAGMTEINFGLQSNINDKNQLFLSYSHAKFQDVLPTPKSFGLEDANLESINFGYETLFNDSRLTLGLKKEYALNSGKVSMMTPKELQSDGSVLYSLKSYEANSDNKYIPYVAYAEKFEDSILTFAAKLDNSDKYGAFKLDYSLPF